MGMLQKQNGEFPHNLHPTSPNDNILHNHGTFNQKQEINIAIVPLNNLQVIYIQVTLVFLLSCFYSKI